MAKQELSCPNCNGKVALGEIICPHCGMNLKSGESFEAQVKRARGKAQHEEAYTGGLYVGIVLAVGLCMFAGYMYQRSMEKVLAERPELFKPHIEQLQYVQDLVAAGDYATARERASALIKQIQETADGIVADVPFRVDQVTESYARPYRRETKWNKRGAKRLLFNLKAKAEHVLAQLPAS